MKNWTDEEILSAIKATQKRISNWHRYETHFQMAMDRDNLEAFIVEMNIRRVKCLK